MKCRDFMVGDFIMNSHDFPMQVTSVGDDYLYADFDGNEGDVWEFDDNDNIPMPIPITREFLEKNGCKFYESELDTDLAIRWFPTKKIYFEWRDYNKVMAIWFDYDPDNEGIYSDILIPVEYVHQMQQILRLAGLTDIANNFKV